VVPGSHSLVLGVGRTEQELRAIARTTDRAVPAQLSGQARAGPPPTG
jgi:hypothetical protein